MTRKLADYPNFKPDDDFKVFTERLENAFFINKTPPTNKVPILLNQIDAGVFKTLRSLCHPKAPSNKSFKDLCALLQRQYIQEQPVWKERQQFFRARQLKNETINSWYLRLKELAADCGFGKTLEAAICNKFVVGLISSVIFDKIAEQGTTLTMDQLVAVAMSMEGEPSRKRDPNQRSRRRRGNLAANTNNRAGEKKVVARYTNRTQSQSNQNQSQSNRTQSKSNWNQIQSNDSGNQGQFRQCWHCGESGGHKFSTCVHKNSYCNFCHELGHLETVCRHVQPEVRSEMDDKLAKVFNKTKVTKQPPPAPKSEVLDWKLCPQCKCIGKIYAMVSNKPCSSCGYKGHISNDSPFEKKKHAPKVPAVYQPPLLSDIRLAQPTLALNVYDEQPSPSAPALPCVFYGGTDPLCQACEATMCDICFKRGHSSHQCNVIFDGIRLIQPHHSKKKKDKCCIC